MSGALVLAKREAADVENAPEGKVRLFIDEDGQLSAKDENGDVVSPQALIASLEALVATKQNAATAATDAELAGAVATLNVAIALKQDASSAATDIELAGERTAREAADTTVAATADAALPKAGGTMSGPLTLAGDPTTNLQPATKQFVAAQIAALINGAPGALDTLKEIADRLGSDESAVEALTATVAGKLGATSNLSDLVNAGTARSNLGLGTAATKDAGAAGSAGKVLNADDPTTTDARAPKAHTHPSTDVTGLGTSALAAIGAAGEVGKVLAADDPTLANLSSAVINPKSYGAKGDGVQLSDAAMTKGSAVLESAQVFTAKDVGKEIEVEGAGPGSGLPLVTTIASVAGGKATLSRAAESTVAAKKAIFASDDTKAIQKAIDAANATFLLTGTPQVVRFPNGSFLLSYAQGTTQGTQECCLIEKSGVVLDGSRGSYLFTMAPVATIVTKEATTPMTAEALEVASTQGFSETNKKLTLSLANFGNIGPAWSAKSATSFTITQTGVHPIPVGTIVVQNRNRCMIATPKESIAEQWKILGLRLDGHTVSAVAGGFAEENQHCIEVWGATQFEIANNEVKRFAGKGVFVEGDGTTLSYFGVHHNEIHHCYGNAIRVSVPASNWSVDKNYIHDSAREELGGVETIIMSTSLNVKRGTIENNIIENWGVVDVSGTEIKCHNNINRVGMKSVPGIRIMTIDKSSVLGNTIDMSQMTEEGAQAIINEGTITDSVIDDNILIGANNSAVPIVQLQFTCENTSFNNNKCKATVANQGVKWTGTLTDCQMNDNNITLLGGTATVLFKSTRGSFDGNVVSGGRTTVEGAKIPIKGNSLFAFEGKATEALRVIAPGCPITGNSLTGAAGNSGVLRLSNAAKDCTVNGNVIEATETNAAWIAEESECDRNLIEGNHLIAGSTGHSIIVNGPSSRARRNHGFDGANYLSRRALAISATIKNVDELIAVTSTSAERVMTLPEAAKVPPGAYITVKDESGGAATKNIKVVPKTPASEKIDGAEVQTINANYGKLVVYSNGVNWFTV